MPAMLNGDGPGGLQIQLEAFRQSDAHRDALFQQMIDDYYQLQQQYRDKCDDYENEVTSRRHWQSSVAELKAKFQVIRQQTESSPFVLALIDGDGALFQDHFYRAAADGGSDAAHYLLNEIKKHIHGRHEAAGQWTVMVQIYANFEGLSRKLAQVGILKSPGELQAFARGFNYAHALINFNDVGSGKERADHKIKEMFRLFVSNVHCKHIIFGGCHDNGYLPNLEPYKRDESVASRMTLLETTPAARNYSSLAFPIVCFSSVFRTEELPEARPLPAYQTPESRPPQPYQAPEVRAALSYQAPVFTPQAASQANILTPQSAPPGNIFTPQSTPQGNVFSPPASSPKPTPQPPSAKAAVPSPSPAPVKPSTYATIGKLDSDTKQINIAPTKPVQRRAILLNIHDQRLDPKLIKPDFGVMQKLNARIKEHKVCNNFHLTGKCIDGEFCQFSHGERLGPKEQQALKCKARERVCPRASDCRDIDCFSGHHCPKEPCAWDGCYFGDLHDLDNVVRMKMFENGEIEIVN